MRYSNLYYMFVVALILTSSLAVSPLPAHAESSVLRWGQVEKPGLKNNIIVNPSAVSRIAVGDANTIYASDNETKKFYKSTNRGESWSDISSSLTEEGAIMPVDEIAVTTGSPANVAVVTDNRTKVYLSTDAGSTWNDTGISGFTGIIQYITMATYIQNGKLIFDIAVGTAEWGNTTTTGQLYIAQVGTSGLAWHNQNITIDPAHIGGEISSIAFSSNYRSDGTILVTTSTASSDVALGYQNKTWLCIGQRDLILQTTIWNNIIAYPIEIATTGSPSAGDAVGVTNIVSSISLPSDYAGNDISKRKVFISYDRQPDTMNANDDVYRIDDFSIDRVKRLNAAGGIVIDITTTSYFGTVNSGILLAGDKIKSPVPSDLSVPIRRSLNPTDITPSWQTATQPPSGPGNAYVRWTPAGDWALCGTSGPSLITPDESAFSRSQDNGDNWEQTSLIDTNIKITDIGISPDARSLFLATYSSFGTEGIWRSAGEPLGNFWGRVKTTSTKSNRLIIRYSPYYGTDDYTLYVAEVGIGNNQLLFSNTRGNTWQSRILPGSIIDMVIENKDTIYVAQANGTIRKSVNNGQVWQAPVPTKLDEINMLTMSNNGHIFTGSRNGKVAFSINNGASFTEIPQALNKTISGDVQVVTDANYSRNNIIYAATSNPDDGIWRWTIGTSAQWEQIDEQITDLGNGACISGLKMGSEGTLYALRSEPAHNNNKTGGMNRSLNPANSDINMIEFDIVNRTLPAGTSFNPIPIFPNTMPHLKLSSNAVQNDLWAVHHIFTGDLHTDDKIYRFTDNICKSGITSFDTGIIGCDPVSGRNQEVNFTWEQLSLSDRYEIAIGKDSVFAMKIFGGILTPASITSPALVYFAGGAGIYPEFFIESAASDSTTTMNKVTIPSLECGHGYYWRVRTRHAITGEIIRSPWSTTKDIIIKAGFKVTTPYYGPQLLAPDNGCGCICDAPVCFSWSPYKEATGYLFQLSENSDMSNPVISTNIKGTAAYQYKGNLQCNRNYFWRVQASLPAPSEWSATFSFKTKFMETRQPIAVTDVQTPIWVWIIIAVSFLVWICLLIILIRRIY